MRLFSASLFFDIIKYRGPMLYRKHFNCYSSRTAVPKYSEKTTEIITGRHLLPLNRKDGGIRFKVTYIDECNTTTCSLNSEQPIVVMLHGAPGTYLDYEPQIDFMIRQGTRVIVPNFPVLSEMLLHRSPKFKNSPRNRAELVHDLLQFLGVDKVDLLVAHSASAYTAMCLQGDTERLSVRSVALLNPAGYQMGILSPWWLYKLIEQMTYNRAGYATMKRFQPAMMKYVFNVGQYTDIDEPLSSVTSLTSRSPEEALSMLQNLSSSKLPMLCVFSENDRLFRAELSYELVQVLGGSKRNISLYDEKGNLKSKGIIENNTSFVSFKNGSHYAMKKYPEVVNHELLQLLNRRL